jgi:hypothetical protein
MCMKCAFILHMQECKQCNAHVTKCEEKKLAFIPENVTEFESGMCETAKAILEIGVIELALQEMAGRS